MSRVAPTPTASFTLLLTGSTDSNFLGFFPNGCEIKPKESGNVASSVRGLASPKNHNLIEYMLCFHPHSRMEKKNGRCVSHWAFKFNLLSTFAIPGLLLENGKRVCTVASAQRGVDWLHRSTLAALTLLRRQDDQPGSHFPSIPAQTIGLLMLQEGRSRFKESLRQWDVARVRRDTQKYTLRKPQQMQ